MCRTMMVTSNPFHALICRSQRNRGLSGRQMYDERGSPRWNRSFTKEGCMYSLSHSRLMMTCGKYIYSVKESCCGIWQMPLTFVGEVRKRLVGEDMAQVPLIGGVWCTFGNVLAMDSLNLDGIY